MLEEDVVTTTLDVVSTLTSYDRMWSYLVAMRMLRTLSACHPCYDP
jgi:hypothetical protein